MNDEIMEEIRQIRERLYEEELNMTTEERIAKTRAASDWVMQQVAEFRARRSAGITSDQREAVGASNG